MERPKIGKNAKKRGDDEAGLRRKHRNDAILILCIIFAAVLCLGARGLFFRESGAYACVSINGRARPDMKFLLSEDASIELTGYGGGKNVLRIKDGYAFISYADCPDKLCQKQKKIKKSGESIVCLPHRIVISISGGVKDGLDATAS